MLEKAERTKLKALAHSLEPVVWVGQKGVSAAVIDELNQALLVHELIKVKLLAGDRHEREEIASELSAKTQSELIGAIGKIIILFRKRPKEL